MLCSGYGEAGLYNGTRLFGSTNNLLPQAPGMILSNSDLTGGQHIQSREVNGFAPINQLIHDARLVQVLRIEIRIQGPATVTA